MNANHIEDLAELYALGTLDDLEREEVARHVASCPACAARLHRAEATVAAMAELEPRYIPPEALDRRISEITARARREHWANMRTFATAIAAALVVAIGAFAYAMTQNMAMHRTIAQDDRALAQIAQTQFAHAPFQGAHVATDAQVLYSKDGAWYYVVVMHPDPTMTIAYRHDGKMDMLGKLQMHGSSGTLYLPVNHKMDDLALLDNGAVVADAHLVY
ncbi:MAG TPA: zf-HC2 domain-containing protein [Candidatus Baltobacteraceae bacterium]|jgi:hypothetical protein